VRSVVADANVLVSFFVERNKAQQQEAALALLTAAEEGEIAGVIPQSIVFEIVYVLQSQYGLTSRQAAIVVDAVTVDRLGLDFLDRPARLRGALRAVRWALIARAEGGMRNRRLDAEATDAARTEVQIWEVLANEVASHSFTRFLDYDANGDAITAGYALLYARRMLLAKHNPLGLVYTLYGSADLRMG
jgi:predicted nucleic acid-binding protein